MAPTSGTSGHGRRVSPRTSQIPTMAPSSSRFASKATAVGSAANGVTLSQQHTAHSDFRLKPRDVAPDRVCGLAPQLLAVHPQAADVLTTYAMLASQRLQGYSRAAVWYASIIRGLGIKAPNKVMLSCCDASDHLTYSAFVSPSPADVTPVHPQLLQASMTSDANGQRGGGGDGARDFDNSAEESAQCSATSGASSPSKSAARNSSVAGGATQQKPPLVPGVDLDLTNAYLGVRGLLAVISALPLLPHLRSIRLRNCGLDSTLIVLLAHAAGKLTKLEVLDVSHNPCSSIGAEAIAELCRAVPTLVKVDVDGIEMVHPIFDRIARRVALNVAQRGERDEAAAAESHRRSAGSLLL
jgi:hypothetical protein